MARDNIQCRDGREAGMGDDAMSDRRKRAKLTAEQAEQIRELRRVGETYAKIAGRFGMSAAQICRIVQGYYWKKA